MGQAHDVVHIVAIAPSQELPPEKAAVAAKDDSSVGPGLSDAADEQLENRAAVLGGVDLAGP